MSKVLPKSEQDEIDGVGDTTYTPTRLTQLDETQNQIKPVPFTSPTNSLVELPKRNSLFSASRLNSQKPQGSDPKLQK
jgi:hypothetical protein